MSVLGGALQSYFVAWQAQTGIIGVAEFEPMAGRYDFKFVKDGETKHTIGYEDELNTIPKLSEFLHKVKDSYASDEELAKQVDSILNNGNPYGPARYELELYLRGTKEHLTIYCRDWWSSAGLLAYQDIKESENTTHYIPFDRLDNVISKEVGK